MLWLEPHERIADFRTFSKWPDLSVKHYMLGAEMVNINVLNSGQLGTAKLLPCPFCGSPAEFQARPYGVIVCCTQRMTTEGQCPVNARTRSGQSVDEAAAQWNTRRQS